MLVLNELLNMKLKKSYRLLGTQRGLSHYLTCLHSVQQPLREAHLFLLKLML